MKTFISGQKSFAAAVAEMLRLDGHTIVGVCCPLNTEAVDPLRAWARSMDINSVDPGAFKSSHIPTDTDLIVCAHNHAYISKEIRNAARYGAISYHPSLLPRHRGKDSIRWAIKMNDPVTGGTVYWLDDSVDGGPIAAQEWCWIVPGTNASELWRDHLFPLGIDLISRVVRDISAGMIVKTTQLAAVATFEPSLDTPRLERKNNE